MSQARTRVAILGAGGRMGGALLRCAQQMPDVAVAAAIERAGHPAVGRDAGVVASAEPIGVPVSDRIDAIGAADVVIDFTGHEAVPLNVAEAARLKKAAVIGTTGLSAEEARAVEAAARTIPVVWAPNMSVGVNVLLNLVRTAAATLGLDYDAEIVEVHHRLKRDAPSGTALALAKELAAARGQDYDAVACYGREGITGERPRGQIGVHAVRAGDVIGDHTVMLSIAGERIELSHKASSRDAFARGALRAAVWAAGRAPGLYGMREVLGLG